MFDICSPRVKLLGTRRKECKDVPRFCKSSSFTSHSLWTASRVRRALEFSSCAVCIGLLRRVRMSSVECLLLKLVGALSFEGRDEFSSSILLYHFSSQFLLRKLGDWMGVTWTHWEIRARRFRTSCLPTRCVEMKSNACVKVDVVWIVVVSLALPLDVDLIDFEFDLESIVIEVEWCGGQ